jgi:hypothetical protein
MKLVRGFALVVLTGIVVGLAACSGDDDDGAAAPPTTTTAAATEPVTTAETAEEAAPGGDGLTPSQERALRLAQNSIDRDRSSPLGLMQYLTLVKGLTKADARYAVDHVRANWKELAIESAQERVDATDGYSPTSLIEGLVVESGYTKTDATYAAFHADVDWRLEAWQAAASWLRNREGLTEAELLKQLESGGFGAVEAQYAVDKVRDDERTRDLLEGDR